MTTHPKQSVESATLTVSVPSEVKDRLGELATLTGRSESLLAADALGDYIARELAIVEAIERGRADARAGRVVPHEEAMRRIRQVIADARRDT